MERCQDCHFWDEEQPNPENPDEPFRAGWGICHQACGKFNKPYQDDSLLFAGYALDEDGWVSYTHLYTRPEFGCILYRPVVPGVIRGHHDPDEVVRLQAKYGAADAA